MSSGKSGRAVAVQTVAMVIAAVVGVVAIALVANQAPVPTRAPEVSTGATEPRYVPQCADADGLGPCVGQVGDSGMWLYVSYRHHWPTGNGNGTLIPGVRTIELCPTEDGGPVACAWVPSVQNNNQGDSGALVYGVN